MNLSMGGITIDSAEPRSLADFWTKALDLEIEADHEGFYMILRPRANKSQPYIGLQKVPEERAGKNRVHIDFGTDDRAAEVARVVALGATEVSEHVMPGLTWTVLQDPEGNEFCIGSYHG